MTNAQQNEALHYFRRHAVEWGRKANKNSSERVNVIKQRNDFVLKVIRERKKTDSALDIGCGTGDLVCDVALMGISAVGVDFSKEMIAIAKKHARQLGCKKAEFECRSIFDVDFSARKYDIISANGFIEYNSYKELDDLLNFSWNAMKPGGSLVLGSRNRLFNIFSLNEFTKEEIKNGEVPALLDEAIRIVNCADIRSLAGFKTAPLQKEEKKHTRTGVKVSTRYQFTPVQLIDLLRKKDFSPVEIFPIHTHGIPPTFKDKFPAVHVVISDLLGKYANKSPCLIPQSSSFMIHSKKV